MTAAAPPTARTDPTVAELISETLAGIGVTRIFGRRFPGVHPALRPVELGDPDLALLLAEADGRVNDRWGAAYIDGSILHVSSQPGGAALTRTVTSPEGTCSALSALARDDRPRTLALYLDLDLEAPAEDESVNAIGEPQDEVVVTLSPSLADLSILAIVGPGVTRGGHVAGLTDLAVRGGIGVLNTFGAKGVFRWDSPYHFGTVGLQARDLELAGIEDHDVILTSGLDPRELPPGALAGLVCQDVAPWQLPALLADWPKARRVVGERPAIYGTIAAIVTPMYENAGAPITPPRAALHLSGAVPAQGVVVCDAGIAGFWVARTFPTAMPGSVVVPACPQPGFAAAAALVCGLDGRACVAVTDGPLDEASELVLEVATAMGAPVALQVWEDGSTDCDDHVAMSQRSFARTGAGRDQHGGEFLDGAVTVDRVGVDLDCLDRLTDALGPIAAWEI